mgnify:CR=1 FL=1
MAHPPAADRSSRPTEASPGIPEPILLGMYRNIYATRRFELTCIEFYRQGLIRGYLHPYLGEEAVAAGAAMIAVGIVAGALMLIRGHRGFFVWAIPGALISAGVMMLADVGLDTRKERIAETEELIEAELASLDPIARAQVLKGVGERQMRSILPSQR